MKVAIVGAGTCGLYLSLKLSKEGHAVSLFEKRGEVGKIACSGLLSAKILDFIPESKALIKNEINYVLIHFPKKTLKVNFSERFFVISHVELDQLLFDQVKNSSAKIFLNKEVKNISELSDYDKIVGCDGPNSFVKKELGIKTDKYKLGIAGFLDGKNNADFVEVWPTKNGFIWKIPRGENTEYGIMEQHGQAKALLDDFLEKYDIIIDRVVSGIIPMKFKLPRHNNIMLCGDSAGIIKPWSGGGVIWGLTSCNILLKNFGNFKKAQKLTKQYFLPRIFLSKIILKVLYFLGFKSSWVLPKNYKIENDYLIKI